MTTDTSVASLSDRDVLAAYDAAKDAAQAVDCGYPNCTREGHEGVAGPETWTHEIYFDSLHNGNVYFVIYLHLGEYDFYADIDLTCTEISADEVTETLEALAEASRLTTLYQQRFAELEAGSPPERATLNHWMLNDAIMSSIVEGSESIALCGERFVAESFGGGKTSTKASICSMCQHVYEGLDS